MKGHTRAGKKSQQQISRSRKPVITQTHFHRSSEQADGFRGGREVVRWLQRLRSAHALLLAAALIATSFFVGAFSAAAVILVCGNQKGQGPIK
jgi:hypothetical protein